MTAALLILLHVAIPSAIAALVWYVLRRLGYRFARAVVEPAPVPRAIPSNRAVALTDEQFARIWKACQPESEIYLAMHQLVARELVEAIDYASRADLVERPGALAQAQGSVNALIILAGNLDLVRTEPERWTAAGAAPKRDRRRG